MLNTIKFSGLRCIALLWAALLLPSVTTAQTPPMASSGWIRPSGCGLDLEVYFFDSVESSDCPLGFAKLTGGTSRINPSERSNNGSALQERVYSDRDSIVAGTMIAEGLRGSGLHGRVPHFLIIRGHLFGLGPSPDSSVLVEVRLERKADQRKEAKEAADTIIQLRKGDFQPRRGPEYDRYQELAIALPGWWSSVASSPEGGDQAGITVKWVGGEALGLHSLVFRDSLGQVIRSHAGYWRRWREELVVWLEGEVKARPKVSAEVIVDEVLGSRSKGSCDRWTTARWLLELIVKDIRQLQGLPIEVEEEAVWPLLPTGRGKR